MEKNKTIQKIKYHQIATFHCLKFRISHYFQGGLLDFLQALASPVE